MPGRFFNDLLETAEKTMGFDPYGESDPSDPVRAWSLKFKAEPKQGVEMEGQKEWLSDDTVETKTSVKIEDCCGTEVQFGFSDSKLSFEAEKNICEGDWKAELEVEGEMQPAKSSWTLEPKIKF